jgi:hypothetical protein
MSMAKALNPTLEEVSPKSRDDCTLVSREFQMARAQSGRRDFGIGEDYLWLAVVAEKPMRASADLFARLVSNHPGARGRRGGKGRGPLLLYGGLRRCMAQAGLSRLVQPALSADQ